MPRNNPRTGQARCVACETHTRPEYVPWHQHGAGCALRLAMLREARLLHQMRLPLSRAA